MSLKSARANPVYVVGIEDDAVGTPIGVRLVDGSGNAISGSNPLPVTTGGGSVSYFTITVNLHGTLSANSLGYFAVPVEASLVSISACASNNSDATLQVGTKADPDGILTAKAIGDSGTPTIWVPTDFDGDLANHLTAPVFPANSILTWLLDYDGASAAAAQNPVFLLTFMV